MGSTEKAGSVRLCLSRCSTTCRQHVAVKHDCDLIFSMIQGRVGFTSLVLYIFTPCTHHVPYRTEPDPSLNKKKKETVVASGAQPT